MPAGKTQLKVWIKTQLAHEIKKLAVTRYGSMKGALSKIVEEALELFINAYNISISEGAHTHAHVDGSGVPARIHNVFMQVKTYLYKKFGFLPWRFSHKDLSEAIAFVRGHDRRTINKWIKLFLQYTLIKQVGLSMYELV